MLNKVHYNLIIKEEAAIDIEDAYWWYENKQHNLGDLFLEFLEKSFSSIIVNPKIYAKKYKEMRQAPLQKFPFVVIYEIEEKNIIIFAVFHTSRNPKKIKNRK